MTRSARKAGNATGKPTVSRKYEADANDPMVQLARAETPEGSGEESVAANVPGEIGLKRSRLRPSEKAMKRTPVKPVNRKRKAERFTDAFGVRAEWVRTLPCVACDAAGYGVRLWPVEAAHVKSRGAGGNSKHLIPLCRHHHAQQHTLGIKTFADKYGLDLQAEAARVAALYLLERE